MKRIRKDKGRGIGAAALFFALLLLIAGCGKKTEPEGEPEIDKTNWKTNIFNEAAFPLPDGAALYPYITPWWDAETGELTYLAKTTVETETEDGSWSVLETPLLVTANLHSGEIKNTTALPGSTAEGPSKGVICADEAVIVLATPDRHYRLLRYDRKTGAAETGDTINSLFPRQVLGIAGAVRDTDGNAAVLSQDDLLFLDRAGKVVRSAALPSNVQAAGLMTLPDGTILAECTDRQGDSCYCIYDPETVSFGEAETTGHGVHVPCGSGFDFCYSAYANDGTSGVYGQNVGEEPVFLLNYLNSGMRGSRLWFAADKDTMIFQVQEGEVGLLARPGDPEPVLYLRGEDIDISNAKIMYLAYADTGMTTAQTDAVSDFNRTYADCQIEIRDYSEQADGANRLALDMVTGVFRPDILIGNTSSPYVFAAVEKGLYTDLSPYLEADPLVTRDNLFDAVERYFDDGRGGLWGLSPNFTVRTIVSTPENLGPYADRGFWTIFDVLDYCEGLPDGAVFSERWTQGKLAGLLAMPEVFLGFTDGDTCSFDSPDFIRCLEFMKTLPTEDEYVKSSPYAEADKLTLTEAYLGGRIMTASGSIYTITDFARFHLHFGTKDWVPIGDPVSEERQGAGISVNTGISSTFLITSSCEEPALAWELCRAFFTDDEYQGGFPSLRTMMDSMAEDYLGREYLWWYERGGKWSMGEGTITEEDRQKPHVSGVFTEEDYAKLTEILDEAGAPALTAKKYDDVKKLIREELIEFQAGVGTAEECAKKIQSRVSIWLAENK